MYIVFCGDKITQPGKLALCLTSVKAGLPSDMTFRKYSRVCLSKSKRRPI